MLAQNDSGQTCLQASLFPTHLAGSQNLTKTHGSGADSESLGNPDCRLYCLQDTLDNLTYPAFQQTVTVVGDAQLYQSTFYIGAVLTFKQVESPFASESNRSIVMLLLSKQQSWAASLARGSLHDVLWRRLFLFFSTVWPCLQHTMAMHNFPVAVRPILVRAVIVIVS